MDYTFYIVDWDQAVKAFHEDPNFNLMTLWSFDIVWKDIPKDQDPQYIYNVDWLKIYEDKEDNYQLENTKFSIEFCYLYGYIRENLNKTTRNITDMLFSKLFYPYGSMQIDPEDEEKYQLKYFTNDLNLLEGCKFFGKYYSISDMNIAFYTLLFNQIDYSDLETKFDIFEDTSRFPAFEAMKSYLDKWERLLKYTQNSQKGLIISVE